jgi:hypothetical protein
MLSCCYYFVANLDYDSFASAVIVISYNIYAKHRLSLTLLFKHFKS